MKLERFLIFVLSVLGVTVSASSSSQYDDAKDLSAYRTMTRRMEITDSIHRKLPHGYFWGSPTKGKHYQMWKMMGKGMMMRPKHQAKAAKSKYSKAAKSKGFKKGYQKGKGWKWYSSKAKGKGMKKAVGVTSFFLVDAETDLRLFEINDGDSILVEDLINNFGTRQIAFECVTFGSVGSVSVLSNNGFQNLDNYPPWTLFGDRRGNFFGISVLNSIAPWSLSCQPFTGSRATGRAGGIFRIQFSISSLDSSDPPTPTESPSRAPTGPSTTFNPTTTPSVSPTTDSPTTSNPTLTPGGTSEPTSGPTESPTSATNSPTTSTPLPTTSPSVGTDTPTSEPSTATPTTEPTQSPTSEPSTASPTDTDPTPDPAITYGIQPDCYLIDDTRFNICLDIASESGEIEDWFSLVVSAKETWERVISSDPWGPWPASLYASQPDEFVATSRPEETVDDMYVAVIIRDIDGAGGRFAEAGPDLIADDSSRPWTLPSGSIIIDPPDLATALDENIFLDLMIHELGHVMGFGPIFDGDLVANGRFVGSNAIQAWRDIGCSGDLPLESTSDETHWNEDCMEREVLTPILQFNREQHFSALTMGALEDLGYTVNRDEEEPFGLSDLGDCGAFCPEASRRRHLRSPTNTTHARTSKPKLSDMAEETLLHAAADRFRQMMLHQKDRTATLPGTKRNVVSYVYEENGVLHSRVIKQHQVEHLL